MPRSRFISTVLPVLLLIVSMASIQSGASLAKSLFPLVGAEGVTAMRLIFAAIILLAILRPWRSSLKGKSLAPLIAYGVTLGGMNLMFYMALQTVPLGIAVALEFTGPLAVALYFSRKPIDFLWIGLAVFGLWLLLPIGDLGHGVDPKGAALALAAGVCWGLYIIFGQRAGNDLGAQGAALGVTIAAICVAPIGIAHAGSSLLDIGILPALLGVAVLSSALPYTLEMIALTRLPARTFGTLMSIEPAFGAISGLVFLGEQLTTHQWLAIGAIIAASVGTTLSSRPKAPLAAPAAD
ncbi:threonine/homoserine exporter RhtA [Pseudomonas sp. ZM23]|uniref:Threonine/homoserine exporter RhtA n=1 Tax=Pseudomonas triclosanedens TaxID=2961893 RepID=A0ABY7A4R0_9PSED|nr:threonine/homoserine exporter RhtA [Pseudomonas triclosanedens]MCP8465552.1 threonine/homoserine exporter RhtA [Pseudomonas triclosanedens]MCP8471047.1 threonine/homoserine exporter RhtA [Pseudomonas triclosanedens]MCP8476851.1 threonine/homoserine exporter RhtA [Pseudomonas triclosanedens]WAI52034.1 threonine/homoserine exporter RhtA [Pseudomonas triclosanedens]